jgi:hypothetical protein
MTNLFDADCLKSESWIIYLSCLHLCNECTETKYRKSYMQTSKKFRKQNTVVGFFQSAVIFHFLMDFYKFGLNLKLNNISIMLSHCMSSKSF